MLRIFTWTETFQSNPSKNTNTQTTSALFKDSGPLGLPRVSFSRSHPLGSSPRCLALARSSLPLSLSLSSDTWCFLSLQVENSCHLRNEKPNRRPVIWRRGNGVQSGGLANCVAPNTQLIVKYSTIDRKEPQLFTVCCLLTSFKNLNH